MGWSWIMNRQSANGGVVGIDNVISQGDGTVTTFTMPKEDNS